MTNDFYGTVLILTDASRVEEIADKIATSYYPDTEYHYKVTESIPEGLPTDLTDQAGAKLRDSPEGSVVFTFYPHAGTTTLLQP